MRFSGINILNIQLSFIDSFKLFRILRFYVLLFVDALINQKPLSKIYEFFISDAIVRARVREGAGALALVMFVVISVRFKFELIAH